MVFCKKVVKQKVPKRNCSELLDLPWEFDVSCGVLSLQPGLSPEKHPETSQVKSFCQRR